MPFTSHAPPTPSSVHHHDDAHPSRLPKAILLLLILLLGAALVIHFAGGSSGDRPRIAVVTASQDPYWDLVINGAKAAAERYDVRLTIVRPTSDEDEQTRQVEGALELPLDGVAISPINASHQAPLLAKIVEKSTLVTFDSDSQILGRLCFIGSDNYTAGRMCGQHVKAALPQGGQVLISVGTLLKENGRQRRQGVIDELLERSFEPGRDADAPGAGSLKGPKYTVTTLIDDLDPARATQLVADALRSPKHADARCVVGLFAYSTPAVLRALRQTDKLGEVKVVGFDVNEQTLAGIESGHVYATLMQDQYGLGFEAVRILADAARGNRNGLPAFQMHYLGVTPVTQENVADVRRSMSRPPPSPTTKPSPS